MTMNINFPNLGIYLENVGKTLNVFGFDIAYYGMTIALGVTLGIMLAVILAKKTGQNPDTYYDLATYAIIISIMGARLYYVIFSWDYYKDNLLSIFNLRQGGLAIYGGVIAAIITTFVFAKKKKCSFGLLVDTAGPGLILGQIIGRWGNFFNREAFGRYTDNLFAMQLPLDAVRKGDVTEQMLEMAETIDGISYIQVHPTFFYESFWNLCILILMILWIKHKKFDGEVFLVYLLGYGVGRFWIEGLRTDQLIIPGIGLPVSQVLAVIMAIFAIAAIYVGRKRIARINK